MMTLKQKISNFSINNFVDVTSAVNKSVIWSICIRIICGSSLAISIINVDIVFVDALSATKFVSQISLNKDFYFSIIFKLTLIIQ